MKSIYGIILILATMTSLKANAEVFLIPTLGKVLIAYTNNQAEQNIVCKALTGTGTIATASAHQLMRGSINPETKEINPFAYFSPVLRISTGGGFNFTYTATAKIFTSITCE